MKHDFLGEFTGHSLPTGILSPIDNTNKFSFH